MHARSTGAKCPHENLYKQALGYRFETDVIQIHFCWPALTDHDQALSVMYALIRGASEYLNIEERDIAGCLQYFRNSNAWNGSYAIVLYDRTPGGSGYVKSLKDEKVFETVLREARKIVGRCKCGGEDANTSCYSCLRSYSNQRIHDRLQRKYVLDFLDDFFSDDLLSAEESGSKSTSAGYGRLISIVQKEQGQEFFERRGFDELFEAFMEYAVRYVNNRRRFVGLMRDYLKEHPKEMNLLVALYQSGLYKDLTSESSGNVSEVADRLASQIGISQEDAEWAVTTWKETLEKVLLKLGEQAIPNVDPWADIYTLLYDDATIDLADKLREHGISTPDEVGYEMTDQYGEVIAEIEFAWTNKKVGFMTDDKIDHRRKAEEKGWKILDTADEIISALGA